MAFSRKNPAMNAMLAKTHDGLPVSKGSPGMSKAKAKESIKQGAASRSNRSTSVATKTPTPITVSKKGKQMLPSPMDILAAPRGGM